MRLADGLAVPTSAFTVDLTACQALVLLRCPFKGIVEFLLGDLVVVVDEATSCGLDGIRKISLRGELVGMPGQVNVERGNGDFARVVGDDGEEDTVFGDQALHGKLQRGRVDPVKAVHLLNKDSLAGYGANEIQCEWRRVFPVSRHHLPSSDSLVGVCNTGL